VKMDMIKGGGSHRSANASDCSYSVVNSEGRRRGDDGGGPKESQNQAQTMQMIYGCFWDLD
jgi:hypothetical protein